MRRRGCRGRTGPLLLLAGALACGGDTLRSSMDGGLAIRTLTEGSDPDPDGFRVAVDGLAPRDIGPTDSLQPVPVPPGTHSVSLSGVSANCTIDDGPSRTVDVNEGETVTVRYTVSCRPIGGSLRVAVTALGDSLDADGYALVVDDTARGLLGPSDSVELERLSPGAHQIALGGVAGNCRVEGDHPRTVDVVAGTRTEVRFVVTCAAASPPTHEGILFGTMYLPNELFDDVQSGSLRFMTPENLLRELEGARARGARLVIRLGGGDLAIANEDGTFNIEKWKADLDRFREIDFQSYIDDGTVVGFLVIDEPNLASRWGGRTIPPATIEELARYSKEIWPSMSTLARVVPTYLASSTTGYKYLDAGWAQYTARQGNPATWLAAQVTTARALGLGLVLSMNVLDGGSGSSGISGNQPGKYSMSADELRSYGAVLLDEPYGCGFLMWKYEPTYYGRPDIRSAMSLLAANAATHPPTPCS